MPEHKIYCVNSYDYPVREWPGILHRAEHPLREIPLVFYRCGKCGGPLCEECGRSRGRPATCARCLQQWIDDMREEADLESARRKAIIEQRRNERGY